MTAQPIRLVLPTEDPVNDPIPPPRAEGWALTILDATPDHAIGVYGNVSLYVWRRATRVAAIPAVMRAFAAAQRFAGGRVGNFGIVEPDSTFPDAEMRARLARIMRDASSNMAASALTFEGDGLRAVAVRKVAGGLALIARPPYPHRVFGAIEEAARWTVEELARDGSASPSADDLVQAMRELRAESARLDGAPLPASAVGQ